MGLVFRMPFAPHINENEAKKTKPSGGKRQALTLRMSWTSSEAR